MRSFSIATLLSAVAVAAAPMGERTTCSPEDRIAAVQKEIATIRSHTAADAAKIPLAPSASRTFFVTPDEANAVAIPVNIGVTASTVRAELVVLATALNADVPQGSDSYTVNANGSVTVDYVQTNRIALPQVDVREVHTFDVATCRIEGIVGFLFGPLTSFTGGIELK